MTDHVIIRGGHVVTPEGARDADVLIRDGVIEAIRNGIIDVSASEIDAHGCWVMPGFVDLHTHLREPGSEDAETIESGTRAAILGGYTAVVAMPNTTPTADNVETIEWIKKRVQETAHCDVYSSAAITRDREGKELVDMRALARAGVRLFTDDGTGVQDGALMRTAIAQAKELGIAIAQHCEDEVLSNHGVMHQGDISDTLGLIGQPGEAEEVMVMRDISLARELDAPIHFMHVSTAKSVAMIREAKRAGANITAEATPHHFYFTHEMLVEQDPIFKVNPPLRREQDRVAVLNGLRDGAIDVIATDHAPHAPELKSKSLHDAPPGMLGLETALAAAITELDLGAAHLSALMSSRPAHIAGIADTHGSLEVGRVANVAIVDPSEAWVVDPDQLASKAKNSPFAGRKLTGKVRHTIVNGRVAVLDGKVQQ